MIELQFSAFTHYEYSISINNSSKSVGNQQNSGVLLCEAISQFSLNEIISL